VGVALTRTLFKKIQAKFYQSCIGFASPSPWYPFLWRFSKSLV